MDLKSGNLYWPRHSPRPPAPSPLREDVHCDVVIVGGGLTGAMCAYQVAREGLDVVVLDKRNVGLGSTSASTALVLYELDAHLIELMRQRGRVAAQRSYLSCFDAIGQLRQLTRELGDACEFKQRSSLYLASRPQELRTLRREFAARQRIGLPVQWLDADGIADRFSFSAPGAIHSDQAAELNPLRMTRRLVEAAQKSGARIFGQTECAGLRETSREVHARTTSGHRVTARWAIVATGYEALPKKLRGLLKLRSSYVLVTEPVRQFKGWPGRCLIWESSRPYFYLRTTADNRIMIGGGDEPFRDARRRDQLLPEKGRLLAAKLKELFPHITARPAHLYAGAFGESEDSLPFIGSLQPGSRIHHALCYGANGTNFAMLAGTILRDAILQRPNPNARLFGFGTARGASHF